MIHFLHYNADIKARVNPDAFDEGGERGLKMKPISARVHGCLDYAVVAGFLAAPSLFYLTGLPAVIAYVLAAVHLALTLLTDFPLGAVKVIPLKIHGFVELAVGPCLILLPFLLGFTEQTSAAAFYGYSGILILAVWALTDYKPA